MYCEKCKRLFDKTYCPICGSSAIRNPNPDDLCFLIEKEPMWAEMLEEVLKDNEIPFITRKKLGAGMALKAGPMMERISIFVPYAYYGAATEFVTILFSAEGHGEVYED